MSAFAPPVPPSTAARRPVGVPRRIGVQIALSFATLGLYGIYWAYTSHEDVRAFVGRGIGGVGGALVYLFAFPITAFLLPIEIQRMYEEDGRESPVRAATAFWFLAFGIPWFVKCQRALNEFWMSKGA